MADCGSLFQAEQDILQWALHLACEALQGFLQGLDDQLFAERSDDEQVVSRQSRTIDFSFGPVTFRRRVYCDEQGQSYFKLDQFFQIEHHKRLSPYLRLMMAEIGQVTTMRNTAQILGLVCPSSQVSANSVMTAVHQLGPQVRALTQQAETQAVQRRVPAHLIIEGDAFMIKLKGVTKPGTQSLEIHHFRVYERMDGQPAHRHNFLGTSLVTVKERVINYLDTHYCLKGQTIFLGSDAGPGYSPAEMLDLVPAQAHGEYVVDRYHCKRKIKTTLGPDNRFLIRAYQALRNHDYNGLMMSLDTFESMGLSVKQQDHLDHLRAYLKRNWDYVPSPHDRGFEGFGHLGSVESSHRAFTYRMKKQGKSWTKLGAQAMLGLIEARANQSLDTSLVTVLKTTTALSPRLTVPAVQQATFNLRSILCKAPVKQSCGAKPGRIVVNGPASSPIGHLNKIFTE